MRRALLALLLVIPAAARAEDGALGLFEGVKDQQRATHEVRLGPKGERQTLKLAFTIEAREAGLAALASRIAAAAPVGTMTIAREADRPRPRAGSPTNLEGYAFDRVEGVDGDRAFAGMRVPCRRVAFVFRKVEGKGPDERRLEWLSPPLEGGWRTSWTIDLGRRGRVTKRVSGLTITESGDDAVETVVFRWDERGENGFRIENLEVAGRTAETRGIAMTPTNGAESLPSGRWSIVRGEGWTKLLGADGSELMSSAGGR